jgi:hypothetical protein
LESGLCHQEDRARNERDDDEASQCGCPADEHRDAVSLQETEGESADRNRRRQVPERDWKNEDDRKEKACRPDQSFVEDRVEAGRKQSFRPPESGQAVFHDALQIALGERAIADGPRQPKRGAADRELRGVQDPRRTENGRTARGQRNEVGNGEDEKQGAKCTVAEALGELCDAYAVFDLFGDTTKSR